MAVTILHLIKLLFNDNQKNNNNNKVNCRSVQLLPVNITRNVGNCVRSTVKDCKVEGDNTYMHC